LAQPGRGGHSHRGIIWHVGQAAALAQLCKRITHVDLNTLATDIDELDAMDAGVAALRKALAAAGVEAE
jgi:hypothetical protein